MSLIDTIAQRIIDAGCCNAVEVSVESKPITHLSSSDQVPKAIVYRGDIEYADLEQDTSPLLQADNQFLVQLLALDSDIEVQERAVVKAVSGFQPTPMHYPIRPLESKQHGKVGDGGRGGYTSRFVLFAVADNFTVD